jgi:hypothetical protein
MLGVCDAFDYRTPIVLLAGVREDHEQRRRGLGGGGRGEEGEQEKQDDGARG